MNFLEWLQNTSVAVAVGERWFPWLEAAHVVFLALVVGTIFTVDARLIGFASKQMRISYLAQHMLPWTWIAFIGAVVTGVLMFMANAVGYFDKAPFLIKMGLLLGAGEIVVAEGYMDVIALAQAGFENAVAPLGTALTEDQIGLLWRMAPEPVLCFDGDKAGARAVVIIGPDDWQAGNLVIRDLTTGNQQTTQVTQVVVAAGNLIGAG